MSDKPDGYAVEKRDSVKLASWSLALTGVLVLAGAKTCFLDMYAPTVELDPERWAVSVAAYLVGIVLSLSLTAFSLVLEKRSRARNALIGISWFLALVVVPQLMVPFFMQYRHR